MNKFGSRKTTCLLKHIHDSKFEAEYCCRLLAMKQAREIRDFEIQKSYDIKVHDVVVCRHIVDFVVYFKDGSVEVHETKGYATDLWRLKRNLFIVLYPSVPYIVISKGGNYARGNVSRKR